MPPSLVNPFEMNLYMVPPPCEVTQETGLLLPGEKAKTHVALRDVRGELRVRPKLTPTQATRPVLFYLVAKQGLPAVVLEGTLTAFVPKLVDEHVREAAGLSFVPLTGSIVAPPGNQAGDGLIANLTVVLQEVVTYFK